ncbi:MAG: hypothetical protein GY838_03550 [bacterium]|nr:hypothetical protein [bacterium]
MSYRKTLTLALALAVIIGAGAAIADECATCHGQPEFKVKHKGLYDYFLDYENSVHGVAELECAACHGGDDGTTDFEQAHDGVLDPVRYDRIPATCGACHGEQYEAFITSDHYSMLEVDGTAPNCVTCHGAMDMDFIFATRVKSTCAFCHNHESGVLPGVPDQAEFILGKINVMKGYRSFVNTNLAEKDRAAGLEERYAALTAKWHRFDLEAMVDETKELLGDYRQAKADAVRDKRK